MALSPYKSPENPLNRSRSSSCSSPIRNRVIYQEIFAVGANTLVRSFSCDQVFAKDEAGQPFQATKIQVASFITPDKKLHDFHDKQDREVQTAPKRLELVARNHGNSMAKKRLIEKLTASENSKGNHPVKNKGNSFTYKIFKYILIPLICSGVFCLYINYKECGYVWDIQATENELRESILGQNTALEKINTVLNMCNNSNDVFTMVLTGGVGVGKTYSSSIISHNFPWSSNKLIVFSENSYDRDLNNLLQNNLLICGGNLVVVDDLSLAYSNHAIKLVKSLYNKKRNNVKLLIILIFQVNNDEDRNEIIRKFKDSYISIYHVPFNSLSKDIVEECFNREILRQEVIIPKNELVKLIEDKMRIVDVVGGTTGCKGVADDVSSYYKKVRN